MNAPRTPDRRLPLVDALKAIACLAIVLHHLAAYNHLPATLALGLNHVIAWLYEYARSAVQAFLVIGGFLLAHNLAPDLAQPGSARLRLDAPLRLIGQRYLRLAVPLLAALSLAMLGAALARAGLPHDFIPAAPRLPQLLAHIPLLQDLLHQEALSAGVWYVAVDFQLFALSVLLLWSAQRCGAGAAQYVALTLFAALTLASLFCFNRDDSWDASALYFFGAYGMGALAYWGGQQRYPQVWLAILAAIVILALLLDFRLRIAVAGVVMLLLAWAKQHDALHRLRVPKFMIRIGRISYAIFLIHFPLLLFISAAAAHLLPAQPGTEWLVLLLTLCLSIPAGALFFRGVENRSHLQSTRWTMLAAFVLTGLLCLES